MRESFAGSHLTVTKVLRMCGKPVNSDQSSPIELKRKPNGKKVFLRAEARQGRAI